MQKMLLRESPLRRLGALASRPRLARALGAGALLLGSLSAQAQLSGSKAIPGSGSTGYATLAAAVADLNAQGVGSGGVTFNIAAGYTETADNLLITATGTAANPVVFQKSGAGANPTLTAAAGTSATLDAIIGLQGSDYVTFDGLTLVDPTSNSTATTQMEWGFALLKGSTPTVDGCQNVVIRNCVVTLQKGTATMGIYANNHTPASTTQLVPTTADGTNSNNKFYGNAISGVNNGIYLAGYAATNPFTYLDQNNEVGSIVSGTAATGNTITNFGTTATAYGIYTIYQNALKVQGNSVNSAPTGSAAAPTNELYGVLVSTGGNADLLGNTVNITTNTTFSATYGIQNSSGVRATNGTVTIANNNVTMASTTAASATFYGINNTVAVPNLVVSGNVLSNWTRPNTTFGSSYALNIGTGATTTQNVFGNTVSNFSGSSTGSSVYGIASNHNAAAAVQYYDNTVQNIAGAGFTLVGMNLSGGRTLDVYRNRVSGLTASGGFVVVQGIYALATTTNVTNNLIGDLNAPNGSSTSSIVGLALGNSAFILQTNSVNAQYNSIYLNASSSATDFGTSGITYSDTRTFTFTLRNNVVVNTSTANGTGVTAALRRLAGSAGVVPLNLASATNNNLYYAGTPGAKNLIYAEGSNNIIVNAQQTLTAYKLFMTGREANSVTENPPFVSTSGTSANFLKVSTTVPTQIESGGTPISGITTDYANATRNTTAPDLGAYEGSYQLLDISGPVVAYTNLLNTNLTTSRTLVATITDASGVATGTNAPRLYYRKGTSGAFVFVNATSVSGSQYTFTFDYALLPGGSVAAGDVIQYYVAAQDLAATPNAGTGPLGGSGTNPPGTTAPATLASFQVVGNLSGVYYVGTSTPPAGTPANRVFATLTAAVAAYNLNFLAGPTTFYLLDATYSTAETFPLTFGTNQGASATNTLLVTPYTGVSAAITASSSAQAVVLLNSARYITLDGANTTGGTTRNLTLTSTNASANAGVWVGSQGAGNGSTNITLRNLNVVGGNTGLDESYGIYVSAGPSPYTFALSTITYGDDNDNLVIQNNAITRATEAIFAKANGTATAYDGLQIVDNRIGAAPTGTTAVAAGNILYRGIDLQGAAAPLVSRNVILGMDGTVRGANISAIVLNDNVTDAVLSRNSISGLRNLNANGNGAIGIQLNSTTNLTNTEISNNVISDLLTSANFNSTSSNPFGIQLTGGTGTKVYYNTVNLFGNIIYPPSSANPGNISAGLVVTAAAATGLDVRNNIFANAITTTATTNTVKSYAVYYPNATVLNLSDYNDYYVSGPNGVLGYVGTDVTTLAALKTATGKDANSISTDPIFVSSTNLLPLSAAVAAAGTPLSVTVDYTGATRPSTAPSLGAYQFAPQAVDLAANGLVSPLNNNASTCFGTNTPVTVQIRNRGTAALNFATNPATVTAVVSGPSGSTQTLTQTISTGTLAPAATQNVTFTSLADFTALGTYSFAITATVTGDGNTTNDLLTPAPTLNVVAPVGGTLSPATYAICTSGSATLTLVDAANGSLQLQSSSSATGTFTDVTGATAATYTTPALSSSTYYRYKVTCGTNVAYSTVAAITVAAPAITAATSPLTVCTGSTASLSATVSAGSSVRYFTTATGGTAVGTTNPYTTPALTANATYYAEAFATTSENVGKTLTDGANGAYDDGGLIFTTTAPTTISTVTVYRQPNAAAGTATIQLLNGTSFFSPAIATVNATVPANPTNTVAPAVLTLNIAVPAASGYTLYLRNASPALIRDYLSATPATAYPYTSPSGQVSITGPTTTGYYYYFYNWQTSTTCVSPAARTAIQVNVTTPPSQPVLTATPQAGGTVLLSTPTQAGLTYQFYQNVGGTPTAVGTPTATGTLLLTAGTQTGSYTVVALAGSCASSPSAAVTATVLSTATATLAGVSLRVFPNPTADGQLSLELSGATAKASQLTVLNALGQVVHTGPVAPGTAQLKLGHLAAGVYTFRVLTEQGVLTQRVVRQ
ncbi:MAG TPA: T9SS type A sorting domain-containing protein [Hymenobacter sp.]|uniref:Ig-like domain-containing protein n=1 Tax=Hymenobacter sp. TaxID=1898978 RepID=UPI002D7EB1B2|nr:T9SS type A sorting domain-containing protein [Hymenobacter sp.]HET9503676.1 T9SS type A sorting domain-containing protein [Hymenobacter sp.]